MDGEPEKIPKKKPKTLPGLNRYVLSLVVLTVIVLAYIVLFEKRLEIRVIFDSPSTLNSNEAASAGGKPILTAPTASLFYPDPPTQAPTSAPTSTFDVQSKRVAVMAYDLRVPAAVYPLPDYTAIIYDQYQQMTAYINQMYAYKHGYKYKYYSGKKGCIHKNFPKLKRKNFWCKVIAMMKAAREQDVDWLLYLDSDTFVANNTIGLPWMMNYLNENEKLGFFAKTNNWTSWTPHKFDLDKVVLSVGATWRFPKMMINAGVVVVRLNRELLCDAKGNYCNKPVTDKCEMCALQILNYWWDCAGDPHAGEDDDQDSFRDFVLADPIWKKHIAISKADTMNHRSTYGMDYIEHWTGAIRRARMPRYRAQLGNLTEEIASFPETRWAKCDNIKQWGYDDDQVIPWCSSRE